MAITIPMVPEASNKGIGEGKKTSDGRSSYLHALTHFVLIYLLPLQFGICLALFACFNSSKILSLLSDIFRWFRSRVVWNYQ